MNEILYPLLTGVFTTVVTFFITRKKYISEVRQMDINSLSTELDNVEKATKIWRELSEDLRLRLTADIDSLRKENSTMKEQNDIMHKQIKSAMLENESLKDQMAALEKQLKESRCENAKMLKELRQFNANYKNDLKA